MKLKLKTKKSALKRFKIKNKFLFYKTANRAHLLRNKGSKLKTNTNKINQSDLSLIKKIITL